MAAKKSVLVNCRPGGLYLESLTSRTEEILLRFPRSWLVENDYNWRKLESMADNVPSGFRPALIEWGKQNIKAEANTIVRILSPVSLAYI